jgi:hypothetical protein
MVLHPYQWEKWVMNGPYKGEICFSSQVGNRILSSSEMLIAICETTWCSNYEDQNLSNHPCESLRMHKSPFS